MEAADQQGSERHGKTSARYGGNGPVLGPVCRFRVKQSSTIGSACIWPSATAPRPRRGPAWERSPCVQPHDALIPPLHAEGGGPPPRLTPNQHSQNSLQPPPP